MRGRQFWAGSHDYSVLRSEIRLVADSRGHTGSRRSLSASGRRATPMHTAAFTSFEERRVRSQSALWPNDPWVEMTAFRCLPFPQGCSFDQQHRSRPLHRDRGAGKRACARCRADFPRARGTDGMGARRIVVRTQSLASAAVLCSFLFLSCASVPVVCSVPPPHQRACPGPLDRPYPGACRQAGTASLSPQSIRVSSGALSSNCFVDSSGILDCTVPVSAQHAHIVVSRLGGFSGRGSIFYSTNAGSAVPGLEFHASKGTITWDHLRGEPQAIDIALIDNGNYSPGKYRTTFTLTIDPVIVGPRLEVSPITEARVTIINTNARTGTIGIEPSLVTVSESQGSVLLNLTRTNGSHCDAMVRYRTVAIQGSDFGHYGVDHHSQRGELLWPENDVSFKTISLPILDNNEIQDGNEEFFVEVFDAGCASLDLSSPTVRSRVAVTDDEKVGVLVVEDQDVTVESSKGFVDVGVRRVGGSARPVALDYVLVPGTGAAGRHYKDVSGQLIWRHGEFGLRNIRVQLLNDTSSTSLLQRGLFHVQFSYVIGTTIDTEDVRVNILGPALDTCAGAVAFVDDLDGTVCRKDGDSYTSASCGNSTTCKELISSFNDNARAKIDTGLQECANVAGYEEYADYVGALNYAVLLSISNGCGFPAGTVTLSPPGLDTCAGARAKWGGTSTTCKTEQVTASDGTVDTAHTLASCGSSTECKDWISSINDTILAEIQTGYQACANVTGYETYASLVSTVNYATILSISNACGFPAGTVTLSPPGLDTCAGAVSILGVVDGTVCRKDGDSYTSASCGNSTTCKELISSFDDNAIAKIDTGFEACANVTGYGTYAVYAGYLDYARLLSISNGCGFPAGTVTASVPV